MELHGVHPPLHHSSLGEEKHQMLDLNRRLETYLGRVKLLEGENELLRRETQALRRSQQGATTRREGLSNELCRVRLEVEEAWTERGRAELEVSCLAEEIQALESQRKKVAEAQQEVKEKLMESRKVMEEEQGAQIWLSEKVHHLEHEIHHLIQSHQEDVDHLETTLTHNRPALMPMPPTTGSHNPGLLQLGQEYSQQVTRAWKEAAEVYQGQVTRLEQFLNQSSGHLAHMSQEKNENLLKLQVLEKELDSAQDVRQYLEKNMDQHKDRHSQQLHNLHEHAMGLEVQKEELGQQIESLLAESRGLLQLQLSLGLEVTTYRALLENESLRGNGSSVYQPRNIYTSDAVSSPQGIKYYPSKLSTSQIATPISSIRGIKSRSKPAVTLKKSIYIQKPGPLSQSLEISQCNVEAAENTKSETWAASYPKVQQGGIVENFRPQQVHEEVNYAEPLTSLNEPEAVYELKYGCSHNKTLQGEHKVEEDWLIAAGELAEEDCVVETAITYQIGLNTETNQNHINTGNLDPHPVLKSEQSSDFIYECDKDVPVEPHAPTEAWMEVQVKEETSDSETVAVLEPTFESSIRSPASECEPEEIVFDQLAQFSHEEKSSTSDAGSTSQPQESSLVRTNLKEFEDKLYPDGEEMDTWDSVIERKADLKTDNCMTSDRNVTQHAEPEDDISTRDLDNKEKETMGVGIVKKHIDTDLTSSVIGLELNKIQQEKDQECEIGNEDEKDDDDSQNVSVSWRTELESDSYAQENTLADTRPLIRYKSDETDANTQASHMDESESSEGEVDRRIDETESTSTSKRFGTMEDLCEEAEGGGLDEDNNLGYTHIENRDIGMATGEHATPEIHENNTHAEMDDEEYSDEETEEMTEPVVHKKHSDVYYNEELEMVDRLVEQELESLSTATYSAQFAQHSKAEEMLGQEVGETSGEDLFISTKPEVTVYHNEQPNSYNTSLENAPQLEVQHENLETRDASDKRKEKEECNTSMLTHMDPTEDLNSWPESQPSMNNADIEELNSSDDESSNASQCTQPISTANVKADQDTFYVAIPDKVQSAELVEICSLKHSGQEAADGQQIKSGHIQTTEWEVLENPNKDFETEVQLEDVSDATQIYCHTEDIAHQGAMKKNKESPEVSPESMPAETDIFLSAEPLKVNGKDKDHDIFSSGINNDFWGSNFETGATYQPDDSFDRTDKPDESNQNLGNEGNLDRGNFENPGTDPSKVLAAKEKVKKPLLCGEVVKGDLVHSDDSEDEGRSWSSGE